MDMASFLLVAIFLPLLGALLMWVVAPLGREIVRWKALLVALVTLYYAARVVVNFPTDASLQANYAVTDIGWLTHGPAGLDVRLHLGLDGLGLWMFGLSALLMVTAILVSWEAIRDREPLFYAMLLLLECGCLGVFAARDLILFYVFFEFTLIPLYFLIGIWGSEARQYAAAKFFLFTLAGSVLTFLGLLAIVLWNHKTSGELTFSIPAITAALGQHPIEPLGLQVAIFLALFAGFAIKVPLFPFHTWLPLAHVQAPTAGSVFLAGVLLKIGTYGFARFSIPMLPEATAVCMPWLLWLSAIGIVYGAFVALAQTDIKRLIAYSSVSHLGFCMLGLFALNHVGMPGGALQMVNHGLSTGALFAIVGMIYERYHTREIRQLGGLARRAPWLAFFMVFFTLSSIGLPGMNGFVGEFLVLLGAFQRGFVETPLLWRCQFLALAVLSVSGVVLGAWYMLWLVQRVFFGPLKEPSHDGQGSEHDTHPAGDLNCREILALTPLAVFVLWIGIQPQPFLRPLDIALEPLVTVTAEPVQRHLSGETATAARPDDAP